MNVIQTEERLGIYTKKLGSEWACFLRRLRATLIKRQFVKWIHWNSSKVIHRKEVSRKQIHRRKIHRKEVHQNSNEEATLIETNQFRLSCHSCSLSCDFNLDLSLFECTDWWSRLDTTRGWSAGDRLAGSLESVASIRPALSSRVGLPCTGGSLRAAQFSWCCHIRRIQTTRSPLDPQLYHQ